MPADRGRASQACTACRRQKTRCYGRPGSACLRCERLHQHCSLDDVDNDNDTPINGDSGSTDARLARLESIINANSSGRTNARLSRLEKAVNTLLDKLEEDDTLLLHPHPARTRRQESAPLTAQDQSGESDLETSANPAAAPVLVIRDLATDIGVKSRKVEQDNAVVEALIPPEHALTLLQIFLEHYGRWVVFDPGSSPEALLAQLRKSPLLLCACCLIAVRHTTQELATTLGPPLFERAKTLLATALLVVPQGLEFFQAAIVLCMWSTTVGQVPLSIDSWLLSGFALQHCLPCGLFDFVTTPTSRISYTREELDRWCIWNHLCLVHLHYCVGTSRKAMLSRVEIERCRALISSDHATNYEMRMVAEVFLYWTVYENTSASPVTLSSALAALQTWKKAWGFVLDQPRSQFLEMGFQFAHLLLYDQSLKSRSARAQESLLSDMVQHASTIIQLAIDTTDDRTRHLSDHIYHMITFAAVTLCRLLHLYESQLTAFHDINSLDSLVLTLVTWLRSIGLPCHAAYTLGNVVSEFHKKLRPHAQPTSPFSEHSTNWMDGMLLAGTFPEFFGMEPSPGGNNWDLLPSWAPFYQGPPT